MVSRSRSIVTPITSALSELARPPASRKNRVNPTAMSLCPRVLTICVLSAAWLIPTPIPASPGSAPAADRAKLSILIVYDAAEPTTPASDAPPRVLTAAPVELEDAVAATLTPEMCGAMTLRVDETGVARELAFWPDSPPPANLAGPIQRAVLSWVFEPVRCNGTARAVKIPLIFATNPAAQARDGATGQLLPPRLAYEVRPAHPSAFCRKRWEKNRQFTAGRGMFRPMAYGYNQGGIYFINHARLNGLETNSPTTFTPSQPWFGALVLVDMVVDPLGMPRKIEVRPSEYPLLEPEAAAAAQSWLFRPAQLDGKAVGSRMSEAVVFSFAPLQSSPPAFIQRPRNVSKSEAWDEAPTFSRFTVPIFPTALARTKKEGKATAELRLDGSGTITSLEIIQASREEFAQALRAALWDCTFKPALKNGRPIATRCAISARFTLQPAEMPLDEDHLPALILLPDAQLDTVPASALDKPPRQIVNRAPMWSARPGMGNTDASATLELTIDATGRVRDPEVVDATPTEFGYAAVQAAASWYFETPKSQGAAVATRMRVSVKAGP